MPVQKQTILDYKRALEEKNDTLAAKFKSEIFQQIDEHLKESPKYNQSKTFQETILKTWRNFELIKSNKKKKPSETFDISFSLFQEYIKEHNLPLFYKVEEIQPGDIYLEKLSKTDLCLYQYLHPKDPDDEYSGDWWGYYLDSDPINGKMRIDKPKKILLGIHVPPEIMFCLTKRTFFFFHS